MYAIILIPQNNLILLSKLSVVLDRDTRKEEFYIA